MIVETGVRALSATFLLQPPLTALLARQLGLARAFGGLPPLAQQVAQNMAIASVALPTCAGVILAVGAHDVVSGGPLRLLAWAMAAFWSWRLTRQLAIGRMMPRAWHVVLTSIFVTQGPVFGALLAWVSRAR